MVKLVTDDNEILKRLLFGHAGFGCLREGAEIQSCIHRECAAERARVKRLIRSGGLVLAEPYRVCTSIDPREHQGDTCPVHEESPPDDAELDRRDEEARKRG